PLRQRHRHRRGAPRHRRGRRGGPVLAGSARYFRLGLHFTATVGRTRPAANRFRWPAATNLPNVYTLESGAAGPGDGTATPPAPAPRPLEHASALAAYTNHG